MKMLLNEIAYSYIYILKKKINLFEDYKYLPCEHCYRYISFGHCIGQDCDENEIQIIKRLKKHEL